MFGQVGLSYQLDEQWLVFLEWFVVLHFFLDNENWFYTLKKLLPAECLSHEGYAAWLECEMLNLECLTLLKKVKRSRPSDISDDEVTRLRHVYTHTEQCICHTTLFGMCKSITDWTCKPELLAKTGTLTLVHNYHKALKKGLGTGAMRKEIRHVVCASLLSDANARMLKLRRELDQTLTGKQEWIDADEIEFSHMCFTVWKDYCSLKNFKEDYFAFWKDQCSFAQVWLNLADKLCNEVVNEA